MAHIGANIRALRTKNNVTLPALAQRAGISKGLLSKIETDDASNPSISTLFKIAEGLGTSVAVLLGTERIAVKRQAPDDSAEWRKKLALAFKGRELDPHILDAIQHLRNRKGIKSDDLEHWKFLYTSIENSFKE
ncbi:MAG TPA: helix-turn-helix transcriptional regulator [Lacunisphaera sp.]|nr:helix-turn-helix transcriptional regulator [Lacunisphaera sp.]